MYERLITFVEVQVSSFFPLVLITTDVTLFTKRDYIAPELCKKSERIAAFATDAIRGNYFLLINGRPLDDNNDRTKSWTFDGTILRQRSAYVSARR